MVINSSVEQSSLFSQNVFKRMLLYHWYRQGKSYQEAFRLLCTDYGDGFINELVAMKVYYCFEGDNKNGEKFNFDHYCMGHMDDGLPRGSSLEHDPQNSYGKYQYSGEFANGTPNSGPFWSNSFQAPGFDNHTQNHSAYKPEPPERLPPDLYDENGHICPKLAKRHLMLQCYRANYTNGQCEQYLSKLFGSAPEHIVPRSTVDSWFNRFRAEPNPSIFDKEKSGRPTKVNKQMIDEYMDSHPGCSSKQAAEHFRIAPSRLTAKLNEFGYERLFDRWVKKQEGQPERELNDRELFEYKFVNPQAKACEIGEHFGVKHFWINERLRRMGFVVPKYTKKTRRLRRSVDGGAAGPPESSESESAESNESDCDYLQNAVAPKRIKHHRKSSSVGRPKGCKNIEHKGMLLHPTTGQVVTDLAEALHILEHTVTMTKQEMVHCNKGLRKKAAKAQEEQNKANYNSQYLESILRTKIPPPPQPTVTTSKATKSTTPKVYGQQHPITSTSSYVPLTPASPVAMQSHSLQLHPQILPPPSTLVAPPTSHNCIASPEELSNVDTKPDIVSLEPQISLQENNSTTLPITSTTTTTETNDQNSLTYDPLMNLDMYLNNDHNHHVNNGGIGVNNSNMGKRDTVLISASKSSPVGIQQ